MAIQTQGFQFQNLARYTPVDPTLVGVDFSRIGSGIADAMKLGSSLQQYQMRKQAMEEEQATRESRIAQANAVARLNAARSLEAMKNVELMESTLAKQAEADRERASQILRSGILEFGPRADVERAKGVIAVTPETTALTVAQTQAERARLPLETQAKTLGLTRQIGQAQRAIGRGLDELGETLSLQQQIQATALGGLKLGREQAEIINTEADTRLKNAQALAATAGKARDPLPIVRELNDQIDALLKRPMVYEDGTVTNLQAYEGRMAAKERGEKEGIFGREIKADATLNKYLTELNQLRAIRDRYMQSAIGETGGGGGGARGGGLGGGGMASVTPPSLGEAGGVSPALAEIANLAVTTPSAGVATAAPALATLFPGVEAVTAAAPAAPAPRPAATNFRINKEGEIEAVSLPKRQEGARGIDTTQYIAPAALTAAALASPQGQQLLANIGASLRSAGSNARNIAPLARTTALPVAAATYANELLGNPVGIQAERAALAAGEAVGNLAFGGDIAKQEAISTVLDEINTVLNSNLSRTEKLARAKELQEQIEELRALPMNVRSVPNARGGSALIFPRITSIRPGSDAEELTGPLTESDRIVAELNAPIAGKENVTDYGDLLRRFFYGKNLEERINDILVRREIKKTGGYNLGR